jgi:hypothetical protein
MCFYGPSGGGEAKLTYSEFLEVQTKVEIMLLNIYDN